MVKNKNICPDCHSGLISDDTRLLFECSGCKREFTLAGSVPDFRDRDEYWCNVSREKMHKLIEKTKETGDWFKAAKELIPQYMAHFSDFSRADCQFLWPINMDSRVLDAGSMWGALTLPVAQYCKEIHAVDKTVETLGFLKLRAEQMGLNNVHVAAASLKKLPFPDGFFDFVILNGVLEWVALEQDIVLEKHWGKRRNDECCKYAYKPRQMQLNVLKELKRVLKPGGGIYVAIENAIGYIYLTGCPDGHINLRFVSFLPRWLANAIAKIALNCDYRVYVYSPKKLKKLIEESGFGAVKIWGSFPHYINSTLIIPYELIWRFKNRIMAFGLRAKLFFSIFPKRLMKYFVPSLLVIGQKPGGAYPATQRLINMLVSADVINNADIETYDAVYVGGRSGDQMTANYLVVEKKSGNASYFCKIGRSINGAEMISREADALMTLSKSVSNEEMQVFLPKLKYFGTVEGVPFLVTSFLSGQLFPCKPGRSSIKSYLKLLDERISLAIPLLCKFQSGTRVEVVNARGYLLSKIDDWVHVLIHKESLAESTRKGVEDLKREIASLGDLSLPLCAEHGDFSFYNNLLFESKAVKLVDFEHFENNGNPLFDFANLIFVPLLMTYRSRKVISSFSQFVDAHKLRPYLNKWTSLYSEESGMDMRLVRLFYRIAVIEQNAKEYPCYRDPSSLPLYGEEALLELLALKI